MLTINMTFLMLLKGKITFLSVAPTFLAVLFFLDHVSVFAEAQLENQRGFGRWRLSAFPKKLGLLPGAVTLTPAQKGVERKDMGTGAESLQIFHFS